MVTEIPDPDGSIRYLLNLADGTRTTEQIIADVTANFLHVPGHEVAAAIE